MLYSIEGLPAPEEGTPEPYETPMKAKLILIVLTALLQVWPAAGRNFCELESTYMGEGWFRYRLKSLPDPIFSQVDLTAFVPSSFTNLVESGPLPDNWNNAWYFDFTVSQIRPYEVVFSARSSERHFKRESGTIGISLVFAAPFCAPPFCEPEVSGFFSLPCLVPCPADQADGSATNLLSTIELVPDVRIDKLILHDGAVLGLTYSWVQLSTVRLEGSRDLVGWTNIAYIWGSPPSTTWTTNIPLNEFGIFFRLALVGAGHLTNLPPLNPGNFAARVVVPFNGKPSVSLRVVAISAETAVLSWAGGSGLYQILSTTNVMSGPWENVGGPTKETSATIDLTGTAFYRVDSLPNPP
jgi:hypothetical protein